MVRYTVGTVLSSLLSLLSLYRFVSFIYWGATSGKILGVSSDTRKKNSFSGLTCEARASYKTQEKDGVVCVSQETQLDAHPRWPLFFGDRSGATWKSKFRARVTFIMN